MGIIVEALLRIAVEHAVKHIAALIKKYPATIVMGILSAVKYFRL